MKKGFTLIELLAVIVILAIIALIATPIILGIINDAREQSNKRSTELYAKGLELAIANKNLTSEFNPSSCEVTAGEAFCDGEKIDVNVDHKDKIYGIVTFENGKIKENSLYVKDKDEATPEECFVTGLDENGDLIIYGYTCGGEITYDEETEERTIKPGKYPNVIIPEKLPYKEVLSATFNFDKCVAESDYLNELDAIEDCQMQEEDIELLSEDELVRLLNSEAVLGRILFDITYRDTVYMNVTGIHEQAFSYVQLDSVTIPKSVTYIGDDAFYNSNLKSLKLSEGIKRIGTAAFYSNKLKTLTIPKSVTYIGDGAFTNNLLNDKDAYIYARNEDGTIDNTTIVSYGGSNKSPKIPNGVTTIGHFSFYESSIESVIIPNSVVTIKDIAFSYNKLKNLIIPSSVTNIESGAFSGNPLESVTIKNNKANVTLDGTAFGSFSTSNITWQP